MTLKQLRANILARSFRRVSQMPFNIVLEKIRSAARRSRALFGG
jgi:hypothetical protein